MTEERFAEILQIVNQKKSVTVQELTRHLGTSESTIRRDLTSLHKANKLIKVHGGATAIDMEYATKDAEVSVRRDLNIEEKSRIGAYAATLIQPDDFIYLDAGTSTDYLIDCIEERGAVYVTNAISHAQKLLRRGFSVYLLGGELKKTTEAIVGGEALNSLKKYNFTKGFFGTNGIDEEHGLTTPDVNEALVKEQAVKRCRESYILADSTKFGQISPVRFAEFADVLVITSELKEQKFQNKKNIVEVKKA
ncbi:transcriptional regulator, DeoR family [Hespellia stercorisuis DSM 15480]|uniref:Transcriptional regulator, DeoR family n=1 Tax=Hespellia stercorisuis DSM 15480 TaxID=1121950 RepID=A0A1M6HVD7_9FIRM|nr:DeoR/GlpR family DNA-binding transcription regulator [Hespellia stercorisuis]SHJ26057.1 transcriptional regulator, DeoR family [Hespellia stercorisuis DSM 15480]